MKQYIDKAALVAEIERRRDLYYKYYMKNGAGSIAECKYDEDREILAFLDTLEVKEVDFENSVKGRIDYPLIGVDFPNIYPNYKELKDYCDKNGIKDEDKVKIIIIKENVIL